MRWLLKAGYDFPNYINADDIAATLPSGGDRAARAAQEIFWQRRDAALANDESLTYETVMSHPSHIDTMHKAASRGYRVALIFVGLEDPLLNVARVAARVALGEHDVPRDRILARYDLTMGTALPAAVKVAHSAIIFDNSRGIGGPPILVANITDQDAVYWTHPGITWHERFLIPGLGRRLRCAGPARA